MNRAEGTWIARTANSSYDLEGSRFRRPRRQFGAVIESRPGYVIRGTSLRRPILRKQTCPCLGKADGT